MARSFEGVGEIIIKFRTNLEEASYEHFSLLEQHLISRSNGFLCIVCFKKFTRAGNIFISHELADWREGQGVMLMGFSDNRRRHCRKKHRFLVCELSNCNKKLFTRGDLDFHQTQDTHYCAACIKDYQGRHRYPPRGQSTPNTSIGDLDLASGIQVGSPAYSTPTASPMSSPELSPTSPPDFNLCCIEPNKMHGEEAVRLDPNVSGMVVSIMALAVTLKSNGPENITSKIIDDIVRNSICYNSWCRERYGPENLQTPHAIVLSSPPYTSVTYIQFKEDWTGYLVFDSFKDCFELFCLSCRYGICTVADECVALILTDETLYIFTLEMDSENEDICQRHPCVISHSRDPCLPTFLYYYFTSLLEAKLDNDERFYYFSDQQFSFHVLDLNMRDAFVI